MTKRRPFSRIEQYLQAVPTWLFVMGTVSILAGAIVWIDSEAGSRSSFKSIVKLLLQNAESIAIVAAVALYFKEIPDRKAQKHYEAWQVIDNAAAAKVPTSYARKQAIEDLNKDGASLASIDAPGADLVQIHLQKANLFRADLSGADLTLANLSSADLKSANLSSADLQYTDLIDADLSGANLSNARNWTKEQLASAKLCQTTLPEGCDLDPNRDCNY